MDVVTDVLYVLITLVAFALLAILVGVLDRADRPTPDSRRTDPQPSDGGQAAR